MPRQHTFIQNLNNNDNYRLSIQDRNIIPATNNNYLTLEKSEVNRKVKEIKAFLKEELGSEYTDVGQYRNKINEIANGTNYNLHWQEMEINFQANTEHVKSLHKPSREVSIGQKNKITPYLLEAIEQELEKDKEASRLLNKFWEKITENDTAEQRANKQNKGISLGTSLFFTALFIVGIFTPFMIPAFASYLAASASVFGTGAVIMGGVSIYEGIKYKQARDDYNIKVGNLRTEQESKIKQEEEQNNIQKQNEYNQTDQQFNNLLSIVKPQKQQNKLNHLKPNSAELVQQKNNQNENNNVNE